MKLGGFTKIGHCSGLLRRVRTNDVLTKIFEKQLSVGLQ